MIKKILLFIFILSFNFLSFSDLKAQDCSSFLTIDINEFWSSSGDAFEIKEPYRMFDLHKFIIEDCLTNSTLEEVVKVLGPPTYKIIKRNEYTYISLFYGLKSNEYCLQCLNTNHGLTILYNYKQNNKITWYMNPI